MFIHVCEVAAILMVYKSVLLKGGTQKIQFFMRIQRSNSKILAKIKLNEFN